MFDTILPTIQQAYSGDRAKRHVAAVSQHHRIQASPGHRAAARYVQEQLDAAGLDTELHSFPANHEASFWTMQSFQEWSCAAATLDLLRDGQPAERLCDFQAAPISVIQRSAPADGVFDVVALHDGTEESHYQDLDVAGKLVLTDGDISRVLDLAVWRRGAAGILFDGMSQSAPGRGPLDLPDARQYTSFWWGKDDPRCFGFVLTPRQGRSLRGQDSGRVRARVDSRFYDGTFEVVSALIPGTTGQEVLSVSHLCHPQPSANDNASGVAANIEIAATLRRLIDQGRLPQPARSIRFLWLPEMTGTYAYLSSVEDRLPQVVAGVNLDMVGQDQERCHSTFNIECPPDAMASFAPVLMERLWDLMQPPHAHGPGDGPVGSGGKSGAVRHTVAPFSGGSDHYILSDPTVGVATPMLIQWPDRFYHTSEDTLDKVDPAMLARSGSLAAAYVYAVATAGRREATWLAHEIATRQGHQLACLAQDTITEVLGSADAAEVSRRFHDLERSSAYQLDRDRAALISLLALWPDAGPLVHDMSLALEEAAGRELARARSICLEKAGELGADGLAAPFPSGEAWRSRAGRLRPERHYRGPLAFRSLLEGTTPAERDALWEANHRAGRAWWTARTLAEYWADGQRSISEIADRVQQETGQDFGPQILAFFEFLAGQDAVTLHEAGAVQEVIR